MPCLSGFELYSRWVPLSKAIFTPDQFASIKNRSSHASEATILFAIGPESVRTLQ